MSKWKLVPIPITQEMIDAFRTQSSQLISLETCLYAAIDAAPSPPAPAKDGMSERIYLNGYQIKQLAAMVDDDDECELVLAKFPDAEDVETKEKMPAGLYAWYCDYPDEGRTYLPDSASYEGKEEG